MIKLLEDSIIGENLDDLEFGDDTQTTLHERE